MYNLACFGHTYAVMVLCVVAADSAGCETVSGLSRRLVCVVTRVCTILRGDAVRVGLFNIPLSQKETCKVIYVTLAVHVGHAGE